MALIDLRSDLSWYGKKPAVNYIQTIDAKGFTTDEQELAESRFVGVHGTPGSMTYSHTGVRDLGKISTVDVINNNNAFGFLPFAQTLGPSSFTGIEGAPGSMLYFHNGNQNLGVLGTVDSFENVTSNGFTLNMQPAGGEKLPSQFTGISGTSFTHNGPTPIGILAEGYSPILERTGTKFSLNPDQTVTAEVKGFDHQGYYTIARNIITEDAFLVDDVSFSDRGIAKRLAQLGNGSKFPLSYDGTIHNFDKIRTGFHADSTYEEIYGNQNNSSDNKNAGLANTYTAESPIDDMYNKYNLRDDATPNPGYVKQPFDLRGIQREGRTEPSRWGFGGTTFGKIFSTFDLPRAGILTAAERSAIDALRIGKFLISPKGIGFLARQFGYQLMNPNIENEFGNASKIPTATQLYNPLSAPGQALVGGILGVGKFTRHAQLLRPGNTLPFGGGGEYGPLKLLQRSANIVTGMGENDPLGITPVGRMLKLHKQYQQGDGFIGQQWAALTAPSGPGSILGIGVTTHTRTAFTDVKNQTSPYGGLPGGVTAQLQDAIGLGGAEETTYNTSFGEKFFRWNTDNQYQGETEIEIPEEGGGKASTSEEGSPSTGLVEDYLRMTRGRVKEISDGRTPNTTTVLNFGQKSYIGDPKFDAEKNGNGELYTTIQKDNFFNAINSIDVLDASVEDGLTVLKIGAVKFRAYINSLSDSFAPGWDGQNDQGRADPRYQYTSFERTMALDFTVASMNKFDFKTQWNKLTELAKMTHPTYGKYGFYGKAQKVTIGDLHRETPMLITDLSYDWDNEVPWEISTTEKLNGPMYTQVSISFTVLGSKKPSTSSPIYDIAKTKDGESDGTRENVSSTTNSNTTNEGDGSKGATGDNESGGDTGTGAGL